MQELIDPQCLSRILQCASEALDVFEFYYRFTRPFFPSHGVEQRLEELREGLATWDAQQENPLCHAET